MPKNLATLPEEEEFPVIVAKSKVTVGTASGAVCPRPTKKATRVAVANPLECNISLNLSAGARRRMKN
jgi:hypothetical protein